VSDQSEALRRIKEMGLFPTRVLEAGEPGFRARLKAPVGKGRRGMGLKRDRLRISIPGLRRRVKPVILTAFTRQLATLVEAGMPLLRGLRILREQEENWKLKEVIGELSVAVEAGNSFGEAVAAHPRIFNPLYLNMVRAGELGGAMEVTLTRLAEFMEKAQKIKGKVKAAMFYPCAVLLVAAMILTVMMIFVVPRFQQVFDGVLMGKSMPAFSLFVFGLSQAVKSHILSATIGVATVTALFLFGLRTTWGRWSFDQFKLKMPILGPVFRKAAISRFTRTLGTLMGNGVPILQALTIVKETAGNVVLARVISTIHENVKQGEPMAPTLKSSGAFPVLVAGMVDVGEQTGALPEMLMKIADNYDDEVDNAASAMTSLMEPIMIVFLAVVVGSIVVAMFLPLVVVAGGGLNGPSGGGDND